MKKVLFIIGLTLFAFSTVLFFWPKGNSIGGFSAVGRGFSTLSINRMSIGAGVGNGTSGSVLFVDSSALLGQNNGNFYWDDTNKRLGIGNNSPDAALFVRGDQTLFKVASASTRLSILENGYVGIGLASPSTLFEVQGTASASYFLTVNTLQVGGGASVAYNRFGTTTTDESTYVTKKDDLLISGDLEVTASAFFESTASMSGRVFMTSLIAAAGTPNSACVNAATKEISENPALTCTVSARDQKQDINKLSLSGIDIVNALSPVSFAYRDNPNRERWGFIADEVQAVNPRLGDGYDKNGNARSLDENALIAALTKAVQEQQSQINDLTTKIKKLETNPRVVEGGFFSKIYNLIKL